MDLLTYLVLRRHQRCRNLDRTRQETFLRGRTRGWTWPLTPWWTWRRTVTWPPSWEAIWRGGQTQIVNFWRPMKMRACQGKLIFKIDQKPTFSPTTNIWHGCSTVVVKVDGIGCGIGTYLWAPEGANKPKRILSTFPTRVNTFLLSHTPGHVSPHNNWIYSPVLLFMLLGWFTRLVTASSRSWPSDIRLWYSPVWTALHICR